ncbi:flagellar basal-body MS-ring/collar protein FliF [Sporolactobacillus vineae]|uniref:flagellar basal-body MS-ring/collar protein FliF n=1 Tax=Sporolactobacillus vineae TaxID=444463 RepID=UPI000289E0EE|nr:flagellar basal-body MS-ring/collar protein FliF [Sporolactobacillus vineae]
MKEKIQGWYRRIRSYWAELPKKKKIWFTSGAAGLLIVLILVLLLTNVKHYAPLYSNLSTNEAGQITDALKSQKVPYKLSNGGTTISVPSSQVNQLKVSLAAQGIPKTGQIDYSFFGQNAGFGMTDRQFEVLQRAAMQTELANLISNSKGVKSAKVMITLPPEDVWVSNQKNQSQASASVVLNVDPGYQLSNAQVRGLYHLISKSVPNLPEHNIVIMDQYYNYYDLNSGGSGDSTMSAYQTQEQITRNVEDNIQRRVTQMLTTMMGQGKVLVNVTANVDMTRTKEKQDLVLPVNQQTMEGLQTSTEHIAETYTGTGAAGQAGTGTNDVPTYQAGTNGNGNYQKVEDRVNYEFNRIHKDITHSPYKVTDLGIQVLIEPPNVNNVNSLSQQRINDVKSILNSVVETSISDNQGQEIPAAQINQKTYVSVGRLNGQVTPPVQSGWGIWPYVIGGAVLAAAAGVITWIILRRRRKTEEVNAAATADESVPQEDELAAALNKETPEQRKYNDLERLARQKPDDFVKLLRGWMSDDR